MSYSYISSDTSCSSSSGSTSSSSSYSYGVRSISSTPQEVGHRNRTNSTPPVKQGLSLKRLQRSNSNGHIENSIHSTLVRKRNQLGKSVVLAADELFVKKFPGMESIAKGLDVFFASDLDKEENQEKFFFVLNQSCASIVSDSRKRFKEIQISNYLLSKIKQMPLLQLIHFLYAISKNNTVKFGSKQDVSLWQFLKLNLLYVDENRVQKEFDKLGRQEFLVLNELNIRSLNTAILALRDKCSLARDFSIFRILSNIQKKRKLLNRPIDGDKVMACDLICKLDLSLLIRVARLLIFDEWSYKKDVEENTLLRGSTVASKIFCYLVCKFEEKGALENENRKYFLSIFTENLPSGIFADDVENEKFKTSIEKATYLYASKKATSQTGKNNMTRWLGIFTEDQQKLLKIHEKSLSPEGRSALVKELDEHKNNSLETGVLAESIKIAIEHLSALRAYQLSSSSSALTVPVETKEQFSASSVVLTIKQTSSSVPPVPSSYIHNKPLPPSPSKQPAMLSHTLFALPSAKNLPVATAASALAVASSTVSPIALGCKGNE